MSKIGRPSKYKVSFCDDIVSHMAQGYSIESFADVVGVAISTIYEWRDKHPDFSEAIKRGEAVSRFQWETIGIKAAKGELKGFNAAAWIFNMRKEPPV